MLNYVEFLVLELSETNIKHAKDFPYVMEFFKKYYPDKNIGDVKIQIVDNDNWPGGKPKQTEFSYDKKVIRMHEDEVDIDEKYGWLIHEIGHYLDSIGERKNFLVSSTDYPKYPNEKNEQTPMWYQFHYFLTKGYSEDDVIRLLKESYDNVKDSDTLWDAYKDKFFREYYNKIKEILENNK
jgi:hypothetical protein